MRFSHLLGEVERDGFRAVLLTPKDLDPEISGVSQDTREDLDGKVFVAVRGMNVDATELIDAAASRGAVAVIMEREAPVPAGCAAALVKNSRVALALAAAALYDYPTKHMAMVGITGTDGKTTTAILTIEAMLAAGMPAGGMTSLDFRVLDEIDPNPTYKTTLEAPDVQAMMRSLVDAGVKTAVLETTSHGIALERVTAVDFDIAAYTNLTHEHLDFHRSMEEYRQVKLHLADLARQGARKPGVPKAIVYNGDDVAWGPLATAPADRRISYGFGRGNVLRGEDLEVELGRTRFNAWVSPDRSIAIDLPLTGRFNAYNSMCALGICMTLGLDLEAAAQGMTRARGLRGRMQVLETDAPFAVVIDYAHTPDGLHEVLRELRGLTSGRLLVAFGAAGERDATNRPLMGQAVAQQADYFVITADDARSEPVEEISASIARGAAAAGRQEGADYTMIPDRREAIRHLLSSARPGDLVLLAGKGHEDRLLIGGQVLPWNEAQEAREALLRLKVGG